jgi:hypothetical protein
MMNWKRYWVHKMTLVDSVIRLFDGGHIAKGTGIDYLMALDGNFTSVGGKCREEYIGGVIHRVDENNLTPEQAQVIFDNLLRGRFDDPRIRTYSVAYNHRKNDGKETLTISAHVGRQRVFWGVPKTKDYWYELELERTA